MAIPNLSFSGGASDAATGDQYGTFGNIYKFSGVIPLLFAGAIIVALVVKLNK